MFLNKLPKPLPIQIDLPDDPQPKFIWMKLDENTSNNIQGKISKKTSSCQNFNILKKTGNFSSRKLKQETNLSNNNTDNLTQDQVIEFSDKKTLYRFSEYHTQKNEFNSQRQQFNNNNTQSLHKLNSLFSSVSTSLKEQESVNQLKNLEWKDLSHRTDVPYVENKSFITTSNIQDSKQKFYEKLSIRRKTNFRQYSESINYQNLQNGSTEKVYIKNPFLPTREELFKKYSPSKSPQIKRARNSVKIHQVIKHQITVPP